MGWDSVSQSSPRVVLVAAIAENRVIGADGEMPWHYPEDLQHFRETTMGAPVIMGRVTYESIRDKVGGPLDGRHNIVLSTTMAAPDEENVTVVTSIPDALAVARREASEDVYVIGGAQVYEQFLDRECADAMVLTEIPETYEGDAKFPAWESSSWECVERQQSGELAFVTYERR